MAIFLALALTLTALAFWLKKMVFGIGGVAGFILVAGYSFTLSEATWDANYGMGFFSVGLAISILILTMSMREKEVELSEEEQFDKEMDESIEEQENYRDKQQKIKRLFKPKKSRRERNTDYFSRTGKIRLGSKK